ncbi:MAG: trypsin-like peptidase domain-containing protein [Alphaproteobacteria bacterium]|nr:trypsin-like peptidase domain-containing protein [Alphaproteobacteria bacterium]
MLKKIFFCLLAFLQVEICNAKSVVQNEQKTASLADMVETVLPSVVSISTTRTYEDLPNEMGALRGSPFESFLNDYYKEGQADAKKSILLGSGFIYNLDGYILTCAHVVQGLKDVDVMFNNGDVVHSKIVAIDKKSDIALLKVEKENLKFKLLPIKFGDSDKVRVGDSVVAVGNPFGIGNTVTKGIVSAISRDIQVGPFDDFIQTDAAINKGNSGGPLFDGNGKLIGVNTAIFSPSGGSVGIAFAAPSKVVKAIAELLIKDGVVKRGRLGVNVMEINDELAGHLHIKKNTGVYVTEVNNPDTKLEKGDVILSINNKKISCLRDVTKSISLTSIGSKVPLEILKNGKAIKSNIKIMDYPSDMDNAKKALSGVEFPISILGLRVAEITPEVRSKNKISKGVKGLLVLDVQKDSNAALSGVKVGDVLVELDKVPQENAETVALWIANIEEMGVDSALLTIERNDDRFFTLIKLP